MNRAGQLLLPAALLFGCAATVSPQSIQDARTASSSPAVLQAQAKAPIAHARASRLLEEANRLEKSGDREGASIAGEQALAAFEHAIAASRLESAAERRDTAAALAEQLEARLAELKATQARVEQEAAALELEAKVVEDAQPLVPLGPASQEREVARARSAQTLVAEAAELCAAAEALKSDPADTAGRAQLQTAQNALAQSTPAQALVEARKARSVCLARLSKLRRAEGTNPSRATPDVLLSQLSEAGLRPSRDDRGIVVTFADPWDAKGKWKDATWEALRHLATLSSQQLAFPLLIVVHGAAKKPAPSAERLADLTALLKRGDGPLPTVLDSGQARPLVPPKLPNSASLNQRVEIVFVDSGK